jgi:hypothetical protein
MTCCECRKDINKPTACHVVGEGFICDECIEKMFFSEEEEDG